MSVEDEKGKGVVRGTWKHDVMPEARRGDPRLTERHALIRSGILDADQLVKLIGGLWPHFFLEGPKLSAKDRWGTQSLVFSLPRRAGAPHPH